MNNTGSKYDDHYIYSDEYYDYNKNASVLHILKQHQNEISGTGVYAIILCISSLLTNVAIILTILLGPKLRCHGSYLQIVNFSIANVGISVFVHPIAAYLELQGYIWELGTTMCHVYIYADVLLPFVCLIILLLMNVDRMLLMRCQHSMQLCKSFPVCSKALALLLLLLLPWAIGTSIIVPIWRYGNMESEEVPGYCYYNLHNDNALASSLVSYFVPAIVIIIIITYVLILTVRGRLEDSTYTHSHTIDSNRHVSTTTVEFSMHVPLMTVCLADISYIALWFPYQLFQILMTNCQGCHPPVSAIVAFTWMGATTSLILPLIWLSDENIRDCFFTAVRKGFLYLTKVCCACVFQSQEHERERNMVPLMEWSTTTTVCFPDPNDSPSTKDNSLP